MVEFASRGFDAASGLGALGFELSTPALADTLIGEVFPRHADVGAATVFFLRRPWRRSVRRRPVLTNWRSRRRLKWSPLAW